MSLAWEPNKSSVTRVSADPYAPHKPGPKPKRRGKIQMHAHGDIQGMDRLRKGNTDNSVVSMTDEIAID